MKPKFYIGTAGWNYSDWIKVFYPKNQSKSFDWLNYYAEKFNFVEINSSFYSIPSLKIAAGWANKLINFDDFKLSVKLHQNFTHLNKFSKEEIKAFKSILKLLEKEQRLAGLLIQFPYSFKFGKEAKQRIEILANEFCEFVKFVEVRHNSWLKDEAIDFLKNNNLIFASIDQPQIGNSLPFIISSSYETLYVRLHGRNYIEWKKNLSQNVDKQTDNRNARYDYSYSIEELKTFAEKILSVSNMTKIIYIVFNNHPQGKAAKNALQIKEILIGGE